MKTNKKLKTTTYTETLKKFVLLTAMLTMILGSIFAPLISVSATELNTGTVDPIEEQQTTTTGPAESTETTETQEDANKENEGVILNATAPENNLFDKDGDIPNVTLEEMEEKIMTKTQEIVILVQKVLQVVSVLCFMVCAILTAVGAFTRGGFAKGAIGMLISAVVYACITYADVIIYSITNWLIS